MIAEIVHLRAVPLLAALAAIAAADAAHGAGPDLPLVTRPGANIQRSMKRMEESTAQQRGTETIATLAQGLANDTHTLKLTAKKTTGLPIWGFRVYCPPLGWVLRGRAGWGDYRGCAPFAFIYL